MRSEWIRSYQHLWKTGPKQKNTSAFGCLRLLCLLCSPLGDLQVSGTLSSKFLSEGANFAKFECCLVTSRVHTGLYICFGDALSPQRVLKGLKMIGVRCRVNSLDEAGDAQGLYVQWQKFCVLFHLKGTSRTFHGHVCRVNSIHKWEAHRTLCAMTDFGWCLVTSVGTWRSWLPFHL